MKFDKPLGRGYFGEVWPQAQAFERPLVSDAQIASNAADQAAARQESAGESLVMPKLCGQVLLCKTGSRWEPEALLQVITVFIIRCVGSNLAGTDCSRQESLHDFENSAGVEVHIERAPCSLVRERALAVHRIALQVKKIPRSLIEPPGCTCGGISHANFDLPALHAGLNACSRLEQTYPQAA